MNLELGSPALAVVISSPLLTRKPVALRSNPQATISVFVHRPDLLIAQPVKRGSDWKRPSRAQASISGYPGLPLI
jgi:hypothetical protein